MLTLATYNVLAQSYIKPDRYPYSKPEHLRAEHRWPLIDRVLKEMNADILAIQELESKHFKHLHDMFGAQYDMQFSEHASRVDGAAVLFKRDLQVIERGTLQVHKIAAPFVHLQTPIGPLMFTSLHLKWQRNDTPTSEHLGRRQLLSVIDALAQKTNDPIVLAGDFNANSQSCVIEAAEQRGFRLSCRSQRPWDTTNINRKRRKIDYILTNTTDWSYTPCRLPRLEKDTPMPSATEGSDHLALSVQCR